jgi:phage gp36-like protein
MPYATPAELRARYAQDLDRDEFALHSDAQLGEALAAAGAEIDAWRPPGRLGTAALAVLRHQCLTLARMLAHQDQPLDAVHPIVREGLAVREWLRALAVGKVALPAAADESAPPGLDPPVVVAPPTAFGADFGRRFGGGG